MSRTLYAWFLSVAGGVARVEYVGTWVAELRERGVITEAEIPPAAHQRWQEPHGDRRQELVFIGPGWRRRSGGKSSRNVWHKKIHLSLWPEDL